MKASKIILSIVGLTIAIACTLQNPPTIVVVKNTLDIERKFETVELTASSLKVENLDAVGIRELTSGEYQITQLIDNDGDGVNDLLLFQPTVAALSESAYEVVEITEEERPEIVNYCYSRFVPERTDDYTWENDKVGFRVFGPIAQKMVEDGVQGGTLASGVDAWLKKVDYSIIDSWYKKYTEGTGSYHEDTGEGLDNFHVGASRGVGGIAIKKDSTYYFSKNFTDWKTISTGPIRTSFSLEYEDWNVAGELVQESRIISLDYGSNLSRFEIHLAGTETVSAGLTLHEKDGVSNSDNKSWVSYWQPHGDSELGTAIVASPETYAGFEHYDVEAQDLSNAFAHLNVVDNSVVYYAGFGWKESGQFTSQQEWESYLNLFAEKISTPLTISINN